VFRIVIATSVMIAIVFWFPRLFARFQPMLLKRRDQRERERHAHGGHRQDPRKEVDPAGEPRVGLPGEVLRPLEDGAGDRVVARELREPSAMHSCPIATIGQLQMKTPPIVVRPSANSVKMPVEGEM
jgi:hypothetical protein